MLQFKSITLIMVIGLAILFSGCAGKHAGTPTPTPTVTTTATYTVTAIPTITATPIVMVTTPTPVATAPMLFGALTVDAHIESYGNYGSGLWSVRATIMDVTNSPISLKAQLVSDGQIFEEQSFTVQSGSSYDYVTQKGYPINSTNASLWLFAEGYQPTEYKIAG
jgi:hypothetical protein